MAIEDFGCVFAGEGPGLGGRVEDLLTCASVDGKVVNGFVWCDGLVGVWFERSGGEHGEDGFAVRFGEAFAL